MSAVLVTGSSGFLGAYVVRALAERGDDVIGLDVAPETGQISKILQPVQRRVRMVRGSITDLEGLQDTISRFKVARVVHVAAISNAQALLKDPRTAFEINTSGTVNVLEASRTAEVSRVVHVSSVAALAPKKYEPLDEDHPILDPRRGHAAGFYGASKGAAELFGMAYGEAYAFDYLAVRPAGVYGYGMGVPMYIKPMVENALAGRKTIFPTGAPLKRSFIYIHDCISAILAALDVDTATLERRIFMVSEGRQYTIAQIAEIVRRHIPGAKIRLGEALTEYERQRAATSGALDITAARQDLGFSPRYDLDAGLLDYIETYRRLEQIS